MSTTSIYLHSDEVKRAQQMSEHACVPNCEAIEMGERVFIHALATITPGEELFIDYGLSVDGAVTDDIRAQYTCHCGTSGCRRTMLGSDAESA